MAVNWASLAYLVQVYWPYLTVAGLVGIAVGWRSFNPPKP